MCVSVRRRLKVSSVSCTEQKCRASQWRCVCLGLGGPDPAQLDNSNNLEMARMDSVVLSWEDQTQVHLLLQQEGQQMFRQDWVYLNPKSCLFYPDLQHCVLFFMDSKGTVFSAP